MESTLATLATRDGRPAFRFERRPAHSPLRVWKAITDPEDLSHWFPARMETELEVGAPITFTFEEDFGIDPGGGEILEIDPPRLFAYTWRDDVLRWEIVPDGQGCRLIFLHTLGDEGGGRLAAGRNAAGWDACLEALEAQLAGRTAEQPRSEQMLPAMEQYIERFGLGEGAVHEHPDGYLIRFERDLVWRPVDEVWSMLIEDKDPAVGSEPPRRFANEHAPAGPVTALEVNDPAAGAEPPRRFANEHAPAGPVREVERPHHLEFAWLHDGAPVGRIRWELIADRTSGSRVTVTVSVPSRLADLRAQLLAAHQTHLELFFAALNGDVRPWPAERTEELEEGYAKRLDRGASATPSPVTPGA
jgi:uncharacterized protein YndB with AHSA1/START domain